MDVIFDTILSCLYFEFLIHDVFDKGWVTQSNKNQINQSISLSFTISLITRLELSHVSTDKTKAFPGAGAQRRRLGTLVINIKLRRKGGLIQKTEHYLIKLYLIDLILSY